MVEASGFQPESTRSQRNVNELVGVASSRRFDQVDALAAVSSFASCLSIALITTAFTRLAPTEC